ncbi:MAG TPA: hypothetical protein VFB59_05985 [Candidatus Saccharimonadales bacterium]|nr:hypothetical protein [Candidatus Saccharimonadales bacterium]
MIYGIILPTLLTFVPWLAVRYVFTTKFSRQMTYGQSARYLWPAAIAWEIGVLLPVIPIINETETFGMHTMGGIAAGILFYFVVKAYHLRFGSWWQKPLALYFLVCGLGVSNELFELLLNKTGIIVKAVHQNDTWWDLTANTLGATMAFICAELYRCLHRTKR